MTDTISIKIPTVLNKLLEKISKKEDRSKSSIVRLALQEYLEDLEDAKLGEEAYNNWVSSGCKTVSFEDIVMEDKIDLEN